MLLNRLGVNARILLGALLPIVVLGIFFVGDAAMRRMAEAREILDERYTSVAEILAAASNTAVLMGDYEYLEHIMRPIVQRDEVIAVQVSLPTGEVIIDINNERQGDITTAEFKQNFQQAIFNIPSDALTYAADDELHDPEMDTQDMNPQSQAPLATLSLTVTTRPSLLAAQTRLYTDLSIALLVLLSAMAMAIYVSRSITKPFSQIIAALKALSEKRYDYQIPPSEDSSDVSEMITNVNQLAKALGHAEREARENLARITLAQEEADRANAAKSEFLAVMGHEMRTPLNAIIGPLEIIGDERLYEVSEPQKLYIELMQRSSEQLLALVNDVLDFTQLENNNTKIEPKAFSPTDLIDELSIVFEKQLEDKAIAFKVEYIDPENLRSHLMISDPIRIRQIVYNLLSNALKFTEHEGRIVVSARWQKLTETSMDFSVEVTDDGIGIEPSELENIFHMFHQSDKSSTRAQRGVGLGLSISRKLAERLGGALTVTSAVGKGSSFKLSISTGFAYTDSPEADHRGLELQEKQLCEGQLKNKIASTGAIRILLAENEKDNQHVIIGLLNMQGIEVDIANNGEEALQLYHNNEYQLIFIDCYMPVMNGFTLAQKIREAESDSPKATPLIAISADARHKNIDRSFDAGMNEFLAKPIRRIELFHAIKRYTDQG